MFDNVDIAVLTRFNDLAARYGLKPYDVVAEFTSPAANLWALHFGSVPSNDLHKERQFAKMLRALGVRDGLTLKGQDREIIDALDSAIDHAPKSLSRA